MVSLTLLNGLMVYLMLTLSCTGNRTAYMDAHLNIRKMDRINSHREGAGDFFAQLSCTF